jgi:ATP-dependent Clp protease adaptor protein ClpS
LDLPDIKEEIDTQLELKEPEMYRVLLHNDDYTSMDFVVDILMKVFHKNLQDAEKIMISIHEKGSAVCGVYTYEIAQTKVEQVKKLAKQNEFPLLATMEKDE